MRKNIKKIIAVITMTVSIFTLMGCGQTKEGIKEEVKQGIETKDVSTNTNEEKLEVEDSTTKEELKAFEKLYADYENAESTTLLFTLSSDSESYKPIDECKISKGQSDILKDELLKKCPKALSESLTKYINIKDEIFKVACETGKFEKENTATKREALGTFQKELNELKKLKG